jgi:hypothetical protein
LKSKTSGLIWSNSIDVRFESTGNAKSVEEGVVGGSKSREDAELAIDAELIVDSWDHSLMLESSV